MEGGRDAKKRRGVKKDTITLTPSDVVKVNGAEKHTDSRASTYVKYLYA